MQFYLKLAEKTLLIVFSFKRLGLQKKFTHYGLIYIVDWSIMNVLIYVCWGGQEM